MDERAPVDFTNSRHAPDLLERGLMVIMKDLSDRGHVALSIHHDGSGSAAIYYKGKESDLTSLRGTICFQPDQFLFLRNCLVASDHELVTLLRAVSDYMERADKEGQHVPEAFGAIESILTRLPAAGEARC